MPEIPKNKLELITEELSLLKVRIKEKYATVAYRIIASKVRITKCLKSSLQRLKRALSNTFFDTYYGMRLVNNRTSIIGYLLFAVLLLAGMIVLDNYEFTRQFLHPEGVNDAVIGTTTVLLALFIPLAIALIEDARGSALARQTIVKSIIRFNITPFLLALICLFLFIPQGFKLMGNNITLRNVYAATLICCVWFILMNFYRSYRWLSDGTIYSSGSPDAPPPNKPQPTTLSSYRFAQIARLLSGAKGYEAWLVIWSQWWPPEYEDALHALFLKRQNMAIKSKKPKKYGILSLELEAYSKHFNQRNKEPWFYLAHARQFLLLYASIMKVIKATRPTRRSLSLRRGKVALESVSKRFISSSLNEEVAWELFASMDEYIIASDLLYIGTRKRVQSDIILNYFIEEYLESLFTEKVHSYDASDQKHWQITYDNLYVHRYNVTFMITGRFQEWLYKKLDNPKDQRALYSLDSVLETIFPEADPRTMASLFWLHYNAKNKSDSKVIIKNQYSTPRPFGFIGRSSGFWPDDEDVRLKDMAKFQDEQENNAIKLFATLYQQYFRALWNLKELIATAKSTLTDGELNEEETIRLKSLLQRLIKIQNFYQAMENKAK